MGRTKVAFEVPFKTVFWPKIKGPNFATEVPKNPPNKKIKFNKTSERKPNNKTNRWETRLKIKFVFINRTKQPIKPTKTRPVDERRA